MKTKFLIIAAIIALGITSCKKESDVKKADESAPKVEVKQNFSVTMDVVADKNDDFPLYYTEDGSINFDGDHAVWTGVKGQTEPQTVVLNLSEEIIPTHIRVDFGIKKGAEQGNVTLSKFKVSYYGKDFEFKGADFLKYFIANKDVQTEVDAANGTIKFLKDSKGTFTHFYYPTQLLVDEIAKLTK
jgi:hypothetical protein